ncbi:RICIN domain-containing protein [Streptomyces sp. NPDC056663]|uniref:RICIN domain-containing protein n=1 Tax=Streptomyces sp. NPDC056663 TaxID=3345899 RepID=UPI0036C8FF98
MCINTDRDNQRWDLKVVSHSGPGGAALFTVKNVKDGFCLDLPNYGSVSPQTKVSEYYCDKTSKDNQPWWLSPRPNGTYWIRNLVSNLCIGVCGGRSAGNDVRLQIVVCGDDAGTAQRWTFS